MAGERKAARWSPPLPAPLSRNNQDACCIAKRCNKGLDPGSLIEPNRFATRGECIPVSRNEPRKTAVLVDSDPLWYEAVEDVLGSVSIDVVGKAESFAVGMMLIERHLPDLVIAEPLGG